MKMKTKMCKLRHTVQFLSILLVLMIPIINVYSRLLLYIPPQAIGHLWMVLSDYTENMPALLRGGYLSYPIVLFDSIVGLFTQDNQMLHQLFAGYGGSFGSITFPGITILDPMAFLQYLLSFNIAPTIVLTSTLPLLLAFLVGRVFCSWVCPINTMLSASRYFAKWIHLPYFNKTLITSSRYRYYLIGFGVLLLLFGIIIFPYILPYVMLGRFFYYLTLSKIFWPALIFIGVIITLDVLVQRGIWCNYLCPAGGLLSVVGFFKPIKAKRNEKNCHANCHVCKAVCAWNGDPKNGQFFDCANCGECISKCPGGALGLIRTPATIDQNVYNQDINDNENVSA